MTDISRIPCIIKAIRSYWPVSEGALASLAECLTECRFPKRHKLVEEGRRTGYAYFLERGMTRSFWLVDAVEVTTSFSTEGAIVFSMDELYYDRDSEEFVESVEPLEAFAVRLDDLRRLVSTDIELANWWRGIHQYEYRRIHRSHKERLTLPALDRYREFSSQFPDVCRRARLTDIASYLGINLSTLSRIRRKF